MFIRDVHLVEYEERRIDRVGGVVWLKAFNEPKDAGAFNPLYFSCVSGKKVLLPWPRFENGKVDELSVLAGSVIRFGEKPCHVIKARPKVVDDLTTENRESWRDDEIRMVLDSLGNQLAVFITDDWVFAGLKKGVDLGLKITDVLVGPL
jgi:hypothetical protein